MKTLMQLALLTWLFVLAPAHAEGAFCVVTNNSHNCYYYDANQCRAEASRMGGMCVLNQNQSQQSSTILDSARYVQQQGEMGRAARIERQAIPPPIQSSAPQTGTWDAIVQGEEALQGKRRVVYSCNGVQGYVPVVGCVVIGYSNP